MNKPRNRKQDRYTIFFAWKCYDSEIETEVIQDVHYGDVIHTIIEFHNISMSDNPGLQYTIIRRDSFIVGINSFEYFK